MCNQDKEQLVWLADGSLEPEQEKILRDHIEECPECRAEFDALNGAFSLVERALPEHNFVPDDDFAPVLRWRIRERQHQIVRHERRLWTSGVAAVLVGIAALSLYLTMPRSGGKTDQMAILEQDEALNVYVAERFLDAYDLYAMTGGNEETIAMEELLMESMKWSINDVTTTLGSDAVNVLANID